MTRSTSGRPPLSARQLIGDTTAAAASTTATACVRSVSASGTRMGGRAFTGEWTRQRRRRCEETTGAIRVEDVLAVDLPHLIA